MNWLLLLTKGKQLMDLALTVKPAVVWAKDTFIDLVHRNEVPKELTEAQVKAVVSNDISYRVRNLLVNYLPQALKEDIDDGAKDTKKTCNLIKDCLLETIQVLDSISNAANKVDEAIPD